MDDIMGTLFALFIACIGITVIATIAEPLQKSTDGASDIYMVGLCIAWIIVSIIFGRRLT